MNPLSRAPLYARAEQALRARIAAGEWKPGEALPTEAALARELGISQGTLRRALGVLEAQRLIERRQGIGTYVTEATSERALFHFFRAEAVDGTRATPTSLLHRLDTRAARPDELRALHLAKGARVHRLFRRRFVGGLSSIVEEIALPAALFPGFHLPLGVELSDELYVHYQRHHGITVMRVEEKLSAIAAAPAIAEALGRAAGAPVMHITRIAFDVMDRPVERRLSWMETSALRYAIELR
ncbi:GntR family transcriptional regulator [Sediminicoccus sp. KRV36]|uniref:GntR family transcriptional regulator n=1 Tax=Sediminicoccus sp. KRV36 TaxID=3133721 RepID=UPI00200C717D|nr:GntR family transcriptional regulator [Sediminicoccus rosea]UPY38520.1 GntR family transcriptional regulator [Sediminicoccus rosea]